MTIDEAIKELEEIKKLDCHIKYPEWLDALQLGIEALKAIKGVRAQPRFSNWFPLPGETERRGIPLGRLECIKILPYTVTCVLSAARHLKREEK